jgi:hypothetical protein
MKVGPKNALFLRVFDRLFRVIRLKVLLKLRLNTLPLRLAAASISPRTKIEASDEAIDSEEGGPKLWDGQ